MAFLTAKTMTATRIGIAHQSIAMERF